jgi:hypothetical protein
MRTLARAALVVTAVGTAVAGCFLITGGTSGYQLAPPEAGICSFDAASLGLPVAISCACASSADCVSDGGTKFCCFGQTDATAAGSSCQTMPCDASTAIQLCKKTAECLDAACIPQTCSYSAVSIPVQACGSLSGCTP